MATFIYHNNQHRSNHHTVALSGYPESSKDPIASKDYPFQGIFYNKLYDDGGFFIAEDNSYNWWSSLTTVNAHSAIWEKYITTYTTVCANSAIWNLGANAYTSFYSSSANWNSTDKTLAANIDNWNLILQPNKVYSNQVQEFTKQKTFNAPNLFPNNPNNIIWNLSASQVTIYSLSANSYFSNFEGNQKGGIYNILILNETTSTPIGGDNIVTLVDGSQIVKFDGNSIFSLNDGSTPLQTPTSLNLQFNIEKYKFPNNTNSFIISSGYAIKFQFLSDGNFLHGKYETYNLGTITNDQFLYYGDNGIVLYVNGVSVPFVEANIGDEITAPLSGGVIVDGTVPYSSGNGILVI